MDNPGQNAVEVVIAGEIVTLTGQESEEYIQRVARFIDKKIAKLKKEKKTLGVNSFMKTLLLSVNITDDLFKETDKNEGLVNELNRCKRELAGYQKELGKLQDENLLLAARLRETRMELTNARAELDEYMDAFGGP